jgi:hypothetical protein
MIARRHVWRRRQAQGNPVRQAVYFVSHICVQHDRRWPGAIPDGRRPICQQFYPQRATSQPLSDDKSGAKAGERIQNNVPGPRESINNSRGE